MKTSHLQSVLARNATTITFYLQQAQEERQFARHLKITNPMTDEVKKERGASYRLAENYIKAVNKMAVIQKDIKKELRHQTPVVPAVAEGIGAA